MLDRRRFLNFVAGGSASLLLPPHLMAQSGEDKPNFEIAGSQQTDPPGYEIAWNEDWELRDDLSLLIAKSEPGGRGFIALEIDSIPGIPDSQGQRVIIETVSDPSATDPETYMSAIPDNRPELEGYAPGSFVHSRHVTERGGWLCHSADVEDPTRALRGIELFYLPQRSGDPVLIVSAIGFLPRLKGYSPDALEFIDSTISINGDWLLGMDDLDAYWQALESVSDGR